MTAYNILGDNYVKLWDIGKAVGLNVYYQDGVQVDSKSPYTSEVSAKADPQPAATEVLRVSSLKGTELTVGEQGLLVISPIGAGCAAISSDPAAAALEQVAGYWVIVPKVPGAVTITVTNASGETGSLALTVKEDTSAPIEIDLNANVKIRQEMVQLINEERKANGLSKLPVHEALMNAVQDCAAHQMWVHGSYEWEALRDYGWPYGGGFNLTCFTATGSQYAARTAVFNWVHSSVHFETMMREGTTCLGTGVYLADGMAYCCMVVGDPNGISPVSFKTAPRTSFSYR